MKKNWSNPELSDLEITKTAGGKRYTPKEDDVVYLDPADGYWHQNVGDNLSDNV